MDYSNRMNEIVFEVIQEAGGGFVAECLTESIFTQADSWDELHRNVKETVEAYFFDKVQPSASPALGCQQPFPHRHDLN